MAYHLCTCHFPLSLSRVTFTCHFVMSLVMSLCHVRFTCHLSWCSARGSLRNPSIFTLKKHLLKHLKNKEAQLMLTVETSKSHDNSCDEPVAEGIDLTSHVSSFSLNTCLASPCFNLVDPIDCMRKVLQHVRS